MIALLAALALGGPSGGGPDALTITTTRGETRVEVRTDGQGAPVLPARRFARALGAEVELDNGWLVFTVARQPFRFLLGAPVYTVQQVMHPLAGSAVLYQDTLYVPYQFAAEILPRVFSERYRYDPAAGRLLEAGAIAMRSTAPEPERLPNGLLPGHLVTVDPGHGGVDPGNPGLFFPRGVREKDVVLQIGLLLRKELQERGIRVRMTRSTDTLIALGERGSYCTETCDLFVSLHVNSLEKRRGYTDVRGFETYLLAEARTEDARRVARMENDAMRFEANPAGGAGLSALDFILKDLQLNEHLRESARLAELMQARLDPVHTGANRGVKQAGLVVLTTARRPAVLVELGYSTNRNDARIMTRTASQRALAAAMADAIVEYLREYERKTTPAPLTVGGRP